MAAKRKKPNPPNRVPENIKSIDEMFMIFTSVHDISEGPAGVLGGLLIGFGDHYVELLISEEGAQGLIEQLETFLDGDAPKLFDD